MSDWICYECKDGNCKQCVGVPCQCPCEVAPKPPTDNEKLRGLIANVMKGADMASELSHRLDDGEEGEGNDLQRRASDIQAHLLGSVMDVEVGRLMVGEICERMLNPQVTTDEERTKYGDGK